MTDTTCESVFQADIGNQMQAQGWQAGYASDYTAETALYEQEALDFMQSIHFRQ